MSKSRKAFYKVGLQERLGLALYLYASCFAGIVLVKVDEFEVNAPAIKRVMSGTYITVRSANCQTLTLYLVFGA